MACLEFGSWAQSLTRKHEESQRYKDFLALKHGDLFTFVRLGGGTLHSQTTRIIFFPLTIEADLSPGPALEVVSNTEGREGGGGPIIYKMSCDSAVQLENRFRDITWTFQTMTGPRMGLVEPVMLTQHELAVALHEHSPADNWSPWVVPIDVSIATGGTCWLSQKREQAWESLGDECSLRMWEDDGRDVSTDLDQYGDDEVLPPWCVESALENGSYSARLAVASLREELSGGCAMKKKLVQDSSASDVSEAEYGASGSSDDDAEAEPVAPEFIKKRRRLEKPAAPAVPAPPTPDAAPAPAVPAPPTPDAVPVPGLPAPPAAPLDAAPVPAPPAPHVIDRPAEGGKHNWKCMRWSRGWLRWSDSLQKCNAHCRWHTDPSKPQCKMDRSLTKGSLTLSSLWLKAGERMSYEDHINYKAELSSMEHYAERKAERRSLRELAYHYDGPGCPELREILEIEKDARDGDLSEPEVVNIR
jgi:hypothetical protein